MRWLKVWNNYWEIQKWYSRVMFGVARWSRVGVHTYRQEPPAQIPTPSAPRLLGQAHNIHSPISKCSVITELANMSLILSNGCWALKNPGSVFSEIKFPQALLPA
jgi:hypothetical protein